MLRRARERLRRWPGCDICLLEADVLDCDVEDDPLDAIAVLFGVKTFSAAQMRALAELVARGLRRGGRFSFVEVSTPRHRLVRWPYLFYLERVIPLLGRLLLEAPRTIGCWVSPHDASATARRRRRAGRRPRGAGGRRRGGVRSQLFASAAVCARPR